MKKIRRLNNRGVTLVEVMMVLGVMAFLLGLVMTIMGSVNQSRHADELKQEIITLAQISNELSNSRVDFSNIQASSVIQSGLLPKKYIAGDQIVTPSGGHIILENYGEYQNTISFWAYGLTRDECMLIVTTDFSGITSAMNTNWVYDSGGIPYTTQRADSSCQAGTSNYIGMNFIKE